MIRWLLCLTLGFLSGSGPFAFTSWQEVLKNLPASVLIAPEPPVATPVAPVAQDPAPVPPPEAPKTEAPKAKADARNAKPSASALVNINTATVQELDGLPGIGLHMAQRIIDYRQKNGPFKRLEDLMSVQGIGEKNFQKLKPLITIGTPRQ
jgi:comEA protein